MIERHATAGICLEGKRHRWGEEASDGRGVFHSYYRQPCTRCATVRVIEYTKRGNNVAWYEVPTESGISPHTEEQNT